MKKTLSGFFPPLPLPTHRNPNYLAGRTRHKEKLPGTAARQQGNVHDMNIKGYLTRVIRLVTVVSPAVSL